MITIINLGIGNLGSIVNMLKWIGAPVQLAADPDTISRGEKFILPGVGAFDNGMASLHDLGLVDVLQEVVVHERKPLLGLCLGMQLLTQGSEEGSREGLGWIDARTVRFKFDQPSESLRIPHMGWNLVHPRRQHWLFTQSEDQQPRFYFAHSYHVVANSDPDVIADTCYGYTFASAIQRGNIIGVQFHPEKSHRYGINFLKNFVEYDGAFEPD